MGDEVTRSQNGASRTEINRMKYMLLGAAVIVATATGCDAPREPYKDYLIKVVETDEASVIVPGQLYLKRTGRLGEEVFETPDGPSMLLKRNSDAQDRRWSNAVARFTSPPPGVGEECSRKTQVNIRINNGHLREGESHLTCGSNQSLGRCYYTQALPFNFLVQILTPIKGCTETERQAIHSIATMLKVRKMPYPNEGQKADSTAAGISGTLPWH